MKPSAALRGPRALRTPQRARPVAPHVIAIPADRLLIETMARHASVGDAVTSSPPRQPAAADNATPAPAPVMAADPGSPPSVVPVGYRQGSITAISVLLAFTLAFWRYWSFESPGGWTTLAWVVEGSVAVAAALQSVALFRSLRVEDDQVPEYRRTQQWLLASAMVLLAGLLTAFAEGLLNE